MTGVGERRRSYSNATHKCLHGARQTEKLRDRCRTTRMPQGCGAFDSSRILRWKRALRGSDITRLASLLEVQVHRGAGPAKWWLMATGARSYKTSSERVCESERKVWESSRSYVLQVPKGTVRRFEHFSSMSLDCLIDTARLRGLGLRHSLARAVSQSLKVGAQSAECGVACSLEAALGCNKLAGKHMVTRATWKVRMTRPETR